MSIGDNIRRLRKQAGLTQQELADKSGVAAISIRQYENGKRIPQTRQLVALGEALGVTVQKLLDVGSGPASDDMPNGIGSNDSTIGQRISDLASERKMNLHQLAKMSGVSYNTLYAIVKRNSDKVDRDIVQKVASALDVSAEMLLGLPRSAPPPTDAAGECEYVGMLQHYQEDLPDDALLDEAIATLESYFSHMDKAALLHFSRPLAIAYLALKHEQNKKSAE